MEMLELAFSADDQPNKVRRALLDVARSTKGVLQSPKPIAATIGYGNHAVNYRLIWRVAEEDRWSVRDDLITRIWYMARRHGLTMPYPVNVNIQHVTEAPFKKAEASPAETLAQIPHLPRVAAVEYGGVRALSFGKGEVIFDEGQLLDGVYLLVKGAVSMQLVRQAGVAEIAALGPGEFFGEAGMHGTQTADSRAIAVDDTELLLLGPDTCDCCSRPARRSPATPGGCSTSGARRCNRRGAPCAASQRRTGDNLKGRPSVQRQRIEEKFLRLLHPRPPYSRA
jgi:Cyclic nucleotide-binding domain/Mechanosensitive ion channel MscS, C-terminal